MAAKKKSRATGMVCNFGFYSGEVFGRAGFACSLYKRVGGKLKHIYDGPIRPTKQAAKKAALETAKALRLSGLKSHRATQRR